MRECCKVWLSKQFGGDNALVDTVYDRYAASIKAKVAEMRPLLTSSEWQDLDRAAHAVKGAALSVGDEPLANAAVSLRAAISSADAAERERLVAEMESLASLL